MLRIQILPLILLFSSVSARADLTQPSDIYPILDRVYSWQAGNIEPKGNQGVTGWKHATFYTGVMELYHETGDTQYRDFLRDIASDAAWKLLRVNGDLWRHADNHLMAETYLNLHLDAGSVFLIEKLDVLNIYNAMLADPWEGRRIYDWCDALFMSPPVWAQLAAVTGDDKYLVELDRLFWDAVDYLYDPNWQLFYRDKNYFNAKEANGNPVFWGRGNGWVIGSLVRILNYMPEDWPRRGDYVKLYTDMMERIGSIQMDSGGWPTGLLYPEHFDFDTEVSGTSFFVYGMAWGINKGILDRATYGPMVEKGWAVMNENLNADGSISNIQTVGKEPQPNDDLVDEREYGYGAFILAGLEVAKYYAAEMIETWHGFPLLDDGDSRWADTGSFLGWVEVSNEPYIYIVLNDRWAFLNIDDTTPRGNWMYLFR